MTGARIRKIEKFLGVKKPTDMNVAQWLEKLYELEMDWEEEHGQQFPI